MQEGMALDDFFELDLPRVIKEGYTAVVSKPREREKSARSFLELLSRMQ